MGSYERQTPRGDKVYFLVSILSLILWSTLVYVMWMKRGNREGFGSVCVLLLLLLPYMSE